ncbi:hypothetical protein HW555_006376 [Spodoptera exigua]|uniref:Uncharacterized protein n=1 Tax=Spodoptera exigua TaxID=7107 RepID=A0A835GG82_SPOEX|nr:hypothetical protein HW555_006376 [Spodoptera exigua]
MPMSNAMHRQQETQTIWRPFKNSSRNSRKNINSQMASTFDPETMKRNFNQFAESINKAMSDMKAKPAAA